jgi:hypothetical protein
MRVRFRLWCWSGDYECCFLRRTSAANHCALPLNGRLILAFLRALVGAFKATNTFVAQYAVFGGGSDVTNLIGEKHLRERPLAVAASWHSP